ncbi:unnamed protein product [Mytilus coruscus]|uniref:Novel STAND NTPase 3 domain-containing protein n=1 Tax=Mytilus coruscus TaxID=42192 RepID=A0A6J8AYS7_MYTCO|nr:unnamed protein product [Mytilus coruscus]
MLFDLGLIKVFLVSGLICLATAVVCPDSSQWKLRTRARCNSSLPSYNCLYDESTATFVEFCTIRPDFQRPGYKFIIRGNLDGIQCEKNRFQPIKLWTNGSTDCILAKTVCNEQGQVIHDEGNSTSDRTCRCDYTKGFAFVKRPKQDCFCNPFLEDCSCFLKPCNKFHVMTPDLKEFSIITMIEKRHTALIVTVLVAVGNRLTMEAQIDDKMVKIKGEVQKMETEIKERMQLEKDNIMFKMKLKVNFKEILTTINSKEIVGELTLLTDSEKESITSCLGRIKANKELLEIIRHRGFATFNEFILVLRQHNPELATKIENTKDSVNKEELEEEIEKIYNDKIPENVRRFHDSQTHQWIVNEKMIIETKASMDIYKCLQEGNCICLVGRPGSGKSSILRHVALKLVDEYEAEDFDIIPVVIEPSNMLEYYNERRNQIFLLDDFCGKDKVNNQLLDVWKLDIENILNIINQSDCSTQKAEKRRTKILISCSTSVYNSNKFEPLKKRLDTFVLKLSEFPLTPEEREKMIKKYAPNAEKIDYMTEGTSTKKFDFPLLCKLSKGKSIDEINRLFSDPLQSIKNDLKTVQKDDRLQFCAIALCTLCNNKFETKWLNLNCEPYDIRIMKAVNEMCLEFNLDLKILNDLESIQDQFDNKQMDWLSKSGDTYHHIHDEIFNIASILCGKTYQRCFINHAPSSFIANRFNFQEHCEGLITLKIKYQKLYFDRLFRDLENGINYSTFQNIQLKNENYRKTFIKYCRSRELKFKEILEHLKKNPVKKNLQINTVNNKTPLRRKDTVFNLLDSKAPLIDCSCQGYEDMIHLLLQMNYDVNEQDSFGRTALFVASAKGHIEVVKRLVENEKYEIETNRENVENEENKKNNVNINKCDNKKRSSLHVACTERQTSVVKYLIQKGADIFAVDEDGYSPLHMACVSGNKDIVEHLLRIYIEKGKETEIEKKDNLGKTPIILASSKGENQIVELLLQYKANISATDKRGFTALLAASINGFSRTAKVLIENDANICHVDNDGRTALFIACKKGHKKIVKMLIEINQTIINICDWHHKSPFYIACAEGRLTIANMLCEGGADINLLDEDVKSPIYAACQRGHEKIVQFLLEKNAKIGTSDSHGNLPLHIACKGGYLNIVQLLLKNHTHCLTVPNQWDEKATDVAQKQGHIDIVGYLKEQESKLNNANTEITLDVTNNS